jgi:nucleoside-diphosphate-sugar epimerase
MALDASVPENARKAVAGAAVVYNCANVEYGRWFADLLPLYRSILDAAESVQALYVALDNLYMYDSKDVITESTLENPTTPRCILRKQVSDEALARHNPKGMRVVLLRASDFFGPEVTNAFLTEEHVWGALRQGKTIDWIGNPRALHSYAFTPDVARALADLGEQPVLSGRAWIAPHAPALTGNETVNLAATIINSPQPKLRTINRTALNILGLFIPLLRLLKDTFYQRETNFIANGQALEAKLGWTATPMKEALALSLGAEATVQAS